MPSPNKSRSGRHHFRVLPFEIRSVEKDGSYFEGYAAVHNNIDEYGTIMGKGCFTRDLGEFRANGFLGGLNHDWDNPLGTVSKADNDDHGLLVGGHIVDTQHGRDVKELLRKGVVKKMSFGFDDLDRRYLELPEDVAKYWDSVGYSPSDDDMDRAKNGALLFTRVRCYEASPVMVPGNRLAEITAVRKARQEGQEQDEPERKGLVDFESQALTVLDAVKDVCGRAEQIAELRSAQGRSLSPDRRAVIRQIRDRADAALAACQPRANATDVDALRRELFDLQLAVLA